MRKKPKINIIGCGRVGKTLATLLHNAHAVQIQDICNAHWESTSASVAFLGIGHPCQSLEEISSADIYFITTQDDVIESVCNRLFEHHSPKKNALVVHCSGALSSAILHKAKEKGCLIASLHPVENFTGFTQNTIPLFGFEGDKEAHDILLPLVTAIGGTIFHIGDAKKNLYHAACVLASNYLVVLAYYAEECYKKADITQDTARLLTHHMMQSALNNLKLQPHSSALTGPLVRGDIKTIEKHLAALKEHPSLDLLYRGLGTLALNLTNHKKELKESLGKLLDLDSVRSH